MDCLARLDLKSGVSRTEFVPVLERFGRVELSGDSGLKFHSRRESPRNADIFSFNDGLCTWEFDDDFEFSNGLLFELELLLRTIVIAESCFNHDLCHRWAIGLNLTSSEFQNGSEAWLATTAAFHAPATSCPSGFFEIDHVCVAVDAIDRLSVVDRVRALTTTQIERVQTISAMIVAFGDRRRGGQRTHEETIRARIERNLEAQNKDFPLL